MLYITVETFLMRFLFFVLLFELQELKVDVIIFSAILNSCIVIISNGRHVGLYIKKSRFNYWIVFFQLFKILILIESELKSESTREPCKRVYSAPHRFRSNLAHLCNFTSTSTRCNSLVQLSIVLEKCQSNCQTVESVQI